MQSELQTTMDRFLQTMQRDSSWCCYGVSETIRALELYIVDELLISDSLKIAGRDSGEWKDLAERYKVARFHVVSSETSVGRKFCKDFRIAGLLNRRLDVDEDSSPTSSCGASPLALSLNSTLHPVLEEESHALSYPEDAVGIAPHDDTAMDTFFTWLSRSLSSENPDEASALLDCVYVVLGGDPIYQCWSESLANAVDILRDNNAPACAAELAVRWYAAQLAESAAEHAIVAQGIFQDLPVEAFSCARDEFHSVVESTAVPFEEEGPEMQNACAATTEMLNVMCASLVDNLVRAVSWPSYCCRDTSVSCSPHNEPLNIKRAMSIPCYG